MSTRHWKRLIAKITMRVVGTLAGPSGLGMLCVTPFMLYHFITGRDLLMIVFAAFPLALAAYFSYVAYLVWFRFSPLAVRHICGTLGFLILVLATNLFDPSRHSAAPCAAFAFLGSLVAAYFAYRVASNQLSQLLFPAGATGVRS
jgi:hypothetical protein